MLATDRLLLRPWRVSDARLQRELWLERDPRVPAHRRIDAEGRPSLEELEARIREGAQPRLLALELRETGEVIGYCGLIESTHGPDEPELAYELLRSAWGNGYATEAATTVVAWARESGHRRLWAGVRDWNTASWRVLAKLGFVESGLVEPDAVHGDSIVTTLEL